MVNGALPDIWIRAASPFVFKWQPGRTTKT
jgi:hypothetical protein